jgi:protein SCO1/2
MNTRIALMTAMSLAASAAGFSSPVTNPTCSCCKEVAASPFTKESVYQLDARFTDDSGQPFAIGALQGRPVVLDMFFASCGYACPITVTDMLGIQSRLPAGQRGRVTFVLVTFDPARDTQEVLAKYRSQRLLDGQWILLRGDDDGVRELAALLGVKYRKEADGTFSHSNVLTVLNAKGEIAYQRIGLNAGIGGVCAAVTASAR